MNNQLKTLDSLNIKLGKIGIENYLQIYSDTLHDYLNIYLQEKEKQSVTLFRFSKKFELLATLENINVARLNNSDLFGLNFLYFKNTVYSLKTIIDTSGKQFYLNKYALQTELKNFDYELKWQFPFERKNINSAHIFYANNYFVLLHVNVLQGLKTGQWVLKINSETGKLIRGTKLNSRGETNSYEFGISVIDTVNKTIQLMGQKFTDKQLNQKENKLAISDAAFATVYSIEIDSLGDISDNRELKIPIVDNKTGAKKSTSNYLLRFNHLAKNGVGKTSFETDIFKSSNNSKCYLYVNTTQFNFTVVDENLVLEKNVITSNPLIEQFYYTKDKLDINGKLCFDSILAFENVFYKNLILPIKQCYKTDESSNSLWVLRKSNAKKNSTTFSFLSPLKKTYQLSIISEILNSQNPLFIALSNNLFLISSQIEEHKYDIKLFSW